MSMGIAIGSKETGILRGSIITTRDNTMLGGPVRKAGPRGIDLQAIHKCDSNYCSKETV